MQKPVQVRSVSKNLGIVSGMGFQSRMPVPRSPSVASPANGQRRRRELVPAVLPNARRDVSSRLARGARIAANPAKAAMARSMVWAPGMSENDYNRGLTCALAEKMIS